MSENPEEFVVPADPASAFSAMLDFLAPEATDEEVPAGATSNDPAAAVAGQQPAAPEGTGTAAPATGAPAGGDAGKPGVPGAVPTAGGTSGGSTSAENTPGSSAEPAEGVDAVTILPKFGEMSTAFETKQTDIIQHRMIATLQEEHPKYFAAVNAHPRTLIGKDVPAISGEGTERIRDAEDAASWQDAMKGVLLDEVTSRVEKEKDAMRDVFATVHSSIDMFQNNTDMIPGTKQFDKELADAFVAAAKDYELRTDGKLLGYSVPVQPIINAIRAQLATRRAAPAPAAAPTPQQQRVAEQARTPAGRFDGPQAGLMSQAGQSSSEGADEASGVMAAFYRQNGIVI